MSGDAWAFLGVFVTQVGGIAAVYLKLRSGVSDQRKAATWAARAASNTIPIANGWAVKMEDSVKRIEDLIIDHIQAHADADVHRK